MSCSILGILLLTVLCGLSVADEWYMPNSNLISDKQFHEKIIGDNHAFKFVKYFTPHCPYCRYLKQVMDVLKTKKDWCFKVYDFNCQWYPQFCRSNVKSSSFPYTAIHNEKGQLFEEIHGFYPEPIISQVFQRIDKLCRQAKGETQNIAPQEKKNQGSLSAEVGHEAKQEPKQEDKVVILQTDQVKVEIKNVEVQPEIVHQKTVQFEVVVPEKKVQPQPIQPPTKSQQSKLQSPVRQQQSQQQAFTSQSSAPLPPQQPTSAPSQSSQFSLPSYFSYIFYGSCILVAGYYVYSLHSKPQQAQKTVRLVDSPESDGQRSKQQIKKSQRKSTKDKQQEQRQMVYLADDEL